MKKEELRQLPKVELHCHLDGSLTRGLIERRLGRQVSQEELMVSDDCTSLAEYLEKFDRADVSWTNRDLRKPATMYLAV